MEEYLFAEREVVYEEVVAGSGENASGTAGKITDFEQLSKEELFPLAGRTSTDKPVGAAF